MQGVNMVELGNLAVNVVSNVSKSASDGKNNFSSFLNSGKNAIASNSLDASNTKISKIKLKIEKSQEKQEEEEKDDSTEDKIVSEIQKIKKVDTTVEIEKNEEKTQNEKENKTAITKVDIQNVKKFLIEEYGVNEKCLEIN